MKVGNMKRIGILMMGWLLAVGIGGCGDGGGAETVAGPQEKENLGSAVLVPDIALEDVNPASPFFGTKISPRHFLDQVSVWYFGHAT